MEKLFDRKLLIANKLRALRNPVDGSDFLMRRACDDLADRLSVIDRHFEHAICLFNGTAHATDVLMADRKVGRVSRIESDMTLLSGQEGIVEDGEIVPVEPKSADLVVSLMTLHEFNDVPGMFTQIRKTLKPDGLFLAAFAGGGTLSELRDSLLAAETELTGGASARIYPFMDVRDAGALLQRAGFALPVSDIETVTVRYATPIKLMHDLRAMGASNALVQRSKRPITKRLLQRAFEVYAERHADDDGRLRATFNIIWVSGWASHGSQQKPLKPGSATASLADALLKIENNDG